MADIRGNVPDRSVAAPLGLIGGGPLNRCCLYGTRGGRWTRLCGGWGRRGLLPRHADAARHLEVGNSRRQGELQRRLFTGNRRILPALRHDGWIVLRAGSGRAERSSRRSVAASPSSARPSLVKTGPIFATLGSRIYAIEPDGTVCWTWDFVKEQLGFAGDRWSGTDWVKHKGERVTYDEQFCCSQDLALHGETLVVPAGASVVWLEDSGNRPELRAVYRWREHAYFRITTLGSSIGEDGTVYRQTHRIDNGGEVERLQLRNGEVQADSVPWNGNRRPSARVAEFFFGERAGKRRVSLPPRRRFWFLQTLSRPGAS